MPLAYGLYNNMLQQINSSVKNRRRKETKEWKRKK